MSHFLIKFVTSISPSLKIPAYDTNPTHQELNKSIMLGYEHLDRQAELIDLVFETKSNWSIYAKKCTTALCITYNIM